MKFRYQRRKAEPSAAFPERHSILCPLINVSFKNKDHPEKKINVWALIDSGADVSILPGAFGPSLGLGPNDKTQKIHCLNKGEVEAYRQEIILDVGGWQFETIACLASGETAAVVLGQTGFFDLFRVCFDYSKEEIELKPTAKPIKVESN